MLLRKHEAGIRRAATGANEVRLGTALSTLGLALVALDGEKNRADAQAALEESYAIFVRARGEAHSDPRRIAGHLTDFFQAREAATPGQGHAATAAQWQARRDLGAAGSSKL